MRPPSPAATLPWWHKESFAEGYGKKWKPAILMFQGLQPPEWPAFPSCLSFYNQQVLFLDSRPEVSFPTTLQKAWVPMRADLVCLPYWLYLIGSGFQYKEDIHGKKQLSMLDLSSFTVFLTVHGVLKARMLKWFAIPFSSGPRFVRTLYHDPSVYMAVLHGPAHNFIDLHKVVIHIINLVSFHSLWLSLPVRD